jgi:hypothetical protein
MLCKSGAHSDLPVSLSVSVSIDANERNMFSFMVIGALTRARTELTNTDDGRSHQLFASYAMDIQQRNDGLIVLVANASCNMLSIWASACGA